MKVTFFSVYLNSHQLPLCRELSRMEGVDFTFISLVRTEGSVGRDSLDLDYSFVLREYECPFNAEEAMRHVLEDDVVIFGDMAGKEEYVNARANAGKLFFRYAERLLKKGDWWRFFPLKIYRTWKQFMRYKKSEMYVLCASAYTARDLKAFGFPVAGRCFKWGYFPDVEVFFERVFEGRQSVGALALCSVQRLVSWKQVDLQIDLARKLKEDGCDFCLKIAGDGPERTRLERLVSEYGLNDEVTFLGQLDRDNAQLLMRSCDCFLATSSRKEGWGATLNEAMAAGCCVFASKEMGSGPFLVKDGVNGFLVDVSDMDSFIEKVEKVYRNHPLLSCIGRSAMETIADEWCAELAADRFVSFCELALGGQQGPFANGPMSLSF